jgi:chromosome segregation ATPase
MSPAPRVSTSRDKTLESRVSRLEVSVEGLHRENSSLAATLSAHGEALAALRASIDTLDEKLSGIAVLMERQVSQREGLDRAFNSIGKLEARLSGFESRMASMEAQGSVVQAAGSGVMAIGTRIIATGIVAAVATIIALWASRGAA